MGGPGLPVNFYELSSSITKVESSVLIKKKNAIFVKISEFFMADHNILGKDGENAAIGYLQSKGYRILHRNWKRGYYELDIVATTDEELVIVEVKTRKNNNYSRPEDSVDNRKIKRIVSATDLYIKIFNIDLPVRFDVIAIIGNYPYFQIDHIEDAFFPPVNTYR